MGLSRNNPASLLSLTTVAGNPYHGLVQGGVLTLPNAATRAHPQPTGSAWHREGRVLKVQVPGVDLPARSEAQAASDAAAGLQWLNYALLSGQNSMLYGKALGDERWIYIDTSGTRWLAHLVYPGGSWAIADNTGATIHVRIERFGEFGAESESHDLAVTVPNFGQETPTGLFGSVSQWALQLIDTTPTGSRAVFMLASSAAGYPALLSPQALAFAEVVISGSGAGASATFLTVRTRAQTVGTLMSADRLPFFHSAGGIHQVIPGPLANKREFEFEPGYVPRRQYFFAAAIDYSDSGTDYPTCDGVITWSRSITAAGAKIPWDDETWEGGAPPNGWNRFGTVYLYTAVTERKITGAILAVFYRPDGTLAEITLDQVVRFDVDMPAPTLVSSTPAVYKRTRTGVSGGACTYAVTQNTPGSATFSRTSTCVVTVDLTIKVDGVEATSRTVVRDTQVVETAEITWDAGTTTTSFPASGTLTRQSDFQHTPGALHQTEAVRYGTSNTVEINTNAGGFGFDDASQFAYWGGVSFSPREPTYAEVEGLPVEQVDDYRDIGIPLPISWRNVAETNGSLAVNIVRHAPNVIGICITTRQTTGDPVYTVTWLGEVATPAGGQVTDDIVTTYEGAFDARVRASRHPVTQEVARSTSPLCWV